jgi:Holliday junction resolvase-like predicted endonuclease
MNAEIERRILLSLLNLTRDAPASISELKKESRTPESVLKSFLEELHSENLIALQGDRIDTSPMQRVKLAVKTLALGGDFEEVARSLGWQEFENIVALAFEENGYTVRRHLRFSSQGRRWEIDLLALRKPLLILVECKHWLHGLGTSTTKKAVEEHLSRTRAFADMLPRLRREIYLAGWTHATAVPVLVSLTQSPSRFYGEVPVVPVLQLPSFLSDLPAYAATLAHVRVSLPPEKKIEDYLP